MTKRYAGEDDRGQALAVTAIGAFVLAAAFALTIDWGYGLLQRRALQNDADRIALGVGRFLATNLDNTSPVSFAVTVKEVCDLATGMQSSNARSVSASLVLTYEGASRVVLDSPIDCAKSAGQSTTPVRLETRTVHVRLDMRYRALLASILQQPEVAVGASSRVELGSAPYAIDTTSPSNPQTRDEYAQRASTATAITRVWPIALPLGTLDLDSTQCGPLCDPATGTLITFAQSGARANGVQFLDFSRSSSRPAGTLAEQLITEPASSGSTLAQWFAQPFGGVIGLDTDWSNSDVRPAGTQAPPRLRTFRWSCSTARNYPWLVRASCNNSSSDRNTVPRLGSSTSNQWRGDWVETLNNPITPDLVAAMKSFIARYGGNFPHSSTYGKGVVVWIYAWDCGQVFDTVQSRWRAPRSSDGCDGDVSDRVHLFTVIPITFYDALVTQTSIEGLWGGDFADPGRCQTSTCFSSLSPVGLNPLATTAYLVGDEAPAFDGGEE